jgi:hypothetical protein
VFYLIIVEEVRWGGKINGGKSSALLSMNYEFSVGEEEEVKI